MYRIRVANNQERQKGLNAMKPAIALFVLIPLLYGCSKTTVVFGDNGIVTAITEAPTFRDRKSLIDETADIVKDMCSTIEEENLNEVEVHSSNAGKNDKSADTDSEILKDIKEIFELVENVIDLVPSHSVSVSAICKEEDQVIQPAQRSICSE